MKRFIIFLLFLFPTIVSFGQQTSDETNLANYWPAEQLRMARASNDVSFMRPEEKQVVFYCNLARMNGPLFIKTILEPYLDSQHIKSNRYVKSLVKTLNQQNALPVLRADKLLYQLALSHAKESGERGTTGHDGFNERFRKASNSFWTFAENCYYGQDKALGITIELLIDKGEPDMGHRKNMLNPSLSFIGVSIQPHRSIYEYNCVMEFGGKH